MFSTNVEIRTSDFHKIYDKETGERININKNICIGDRVWLGAKSSVLKGVKIGND